MRQAALASFSPTTGMRSIPTNAWTFRNERRSSKVAPSTASRTTSTTPTAAVNCSFPSTPPANRRFNIFAVKQLRTVARQTYAVRERTKRRHGIGQRRRDDEDRTEAVVRRERFDEEVQTDGQRERLVRLFASERHELVRLSQPCEDRAVRDGPHRDVGDDRPPVARRDRDSERIRAHKGRAAARRGEAPG